MEGAGYVRRRNGDAVILAGARFAGREKVVFLPEIRPFGLDRMRVEGGRHLKCGKGVGNDI